jgi:hypothetical protein
MSLNKLQKTISSVTTTTALLVSSSTLALAQTGITNPAIGIYGKDPNAAKAGTSFAGYVAIMWKAMISIGALLVLLYFVWGAIDWITAAGDKGKMEGARNKMLNAFIGLLLLVSSYTIIAFVGWLFFGTEFNILQPIFIFNNP